MKPRGVTLFEQGMLDGAKIVYPDVVYYGPDGKENTVQLFAIRCKADAIGQMEVGPIMVKGDYYSPHPMDGFKSTDGEIFCE